MEAPVEWFRLFIGRRHDEPIRATAKQLIAGSISANSPTGWLSDLRQREKQKVTITKSDIERLHDLFLNDHLLPSDLSFYVGFLARQRLTATGPDVRSLAASYYAEYSHNTAGIAAMARPESRTFTVGDKQIQFIHGDLTALQADALVTPTNPALQVESGLDGILIRKAGEDIFRQRNSMRAIRPGEATATNAGKLSAQFIIHAAVSNMRRESDPTVIRQATLAALKKADELGLTTIALPSFGTGIIGMPYDESAEIMLDAVTSFLRGNTSLRTVTFALYEQEGYDAFLDQMVRLRLSETSPIRATTEPNVSRVPDVQISVVRGDIGLQAADAIVHATNNMLWQTVGVGSSISRNGGPSIFEQADSKSPIAVGQAVETTAGRLKAKYVIHAAVADRRYGLDRNAIYEATISSLKKADQLGLHSIVFPSFGTGVIGLSYDESVQIMTRAISTYLETEKTALTKITFCLYEEEGYEAFIAGVKSSEATASTPVESVPSPELPAIETASGHPSPSTPIIHPSVQELESKLFAVHSTPILPKNGIMIAGARSMSDKHNGDEPPSFRPTIHFSLNEIVQEHGDWSWDENPYAIIAPITTLEPQLVNLYPNDTFIVGNFRLTAGTILLVPYGTDVSSIPPEVQIVRYDKKVGLRKAVDQIVEQKGGWPIRMLPEGVDTGAVAYIGEQEINDPAFFSALFEKLPHLSYGTHTNPQRGEAFRFGISEQAVDNLMKTYSNHWMVFSTVQVRYYKSLILHNVKRLDRYIHESPLDGDARRLFEEKKTKLMGWLNVVDVDLELRDRYGKTFSRARDDDVERQIFKLRNSPDKLREYGHRILRSLPDAEHSEAMDPRVLAEHINAFSPDELAEFMAANREAFSQSNLPLFYLHYAIGRWLIIKTSRAKEERLDVMIKEAVANLERSPLSKRETDIFGQLAIFLSEYSNRLSTSLEILRDPSVRTFLRKTQGIDFGSNGPRTLEDVLRAHPETRVLYEKSAPTLTARQQEALSFLKQIGHANEQRIDDDTFKRFSSAKSAGFYSTYAADRIDVELEDVMKPMNSARDLNEMMAGSTLSLYQIIRRDQKPSELWQKVGLGNEYRQMFRRDEEFWRSSLSLFEIYQRLKQSQSAHFAGAQFVRGTWANVALRWFWMLTGVTPLHEYAHIAGAEIADQSYETTMEKIWFEGEVKGVHSWVLLLGALANFVVVPLVMAILGVPVDLNIAHIALHPMSVIFSYLAGIHVMAALIETFAKTGDVRTYFGKYYENVLQAA